MEMPIKELLENKIQFLHAYILGQRYKIANIKKKKKHHRLVFILNFYGWLSIFIILKVLLTNY